GRRRRGHFFLSEDAMQRIASALLLGMVMVAVARAADPKPMSPDEAQRLLSAGEPKTLEEARAEITRLRKERADLLAENRKLREQVIALRDATTTQPSAADGVATRP